ncbi:ABC transporter ATP-binding protein [Streptomyces beihaiensis]|uniref:ABC transporter ATP-binding protein n=1 Tax=Streptomyces beihaiensis TaxID=2984495 RepID=A0ABT3TU60_9ACTN|nr:ABC transporter ATP-binding protein [Streptomyces beihaiensis]MCX3060561.1 ABC transporter ATP-binding protein [Streptomyces beihaiensis]
MIQAIGLTSSTRKERPPAVDDVSFEAHPGRVTALLGARGAGKTTVVRMMLELQPGRGITYFRGRPLHRIAHPAREVGVLLGDVPGHPARTVRGQLRMLCSAAGVPGRRADEVLEAVGLVSLRDQRLGVLSRGMDRRLGLACALLADPHTLVLDRPAAGLSARESAWLHDMLRAHAAHGGTVLFTTDDTKEAARTADRVVTLVDGTVAADQEATDFARTRLRPRVAVRSPYAARLGVLVTKEARTAKRSVEVVAEGGTRLSVYGSSCAQVGEIAFRHGILVHQLADEIGDANPAAPRCSDTAGVRSSSGGRSAEQADGQGAEGLAGAGGQERGEAAGGSAERGGATGPTPLDSPTADPPAAGSPAAPGVFVPLADDTAPPGMRPSGTWPAEAPPAVVPGDGPVPSDTDARPATGSALLPPPITVRSARGPLRPLRYEVRRATGIATGYVTVGLVVAVSALLSVFLARVGHTPQARLLAAWPRELPLPPAALGAGLLGAVAFGDEFRHPALAADRGTVPRRLGLLAAKLLVGAVTAVLMAVAVVACDAALLHLVYGPELTEVPADWWSTGASWLILVIACAWAGVLAAGVFRSTTAGLAAVVAVPIVIVPLVQRALSGPSVRTAAGLPNRLSGLTLVHWPFGSERLAVAAVRMVAQPVGSALMLSITTLLCAYLVTVLHPRLR